MTRGYFAIGVWHPKSEENIGTLWRSAHAFGAAFLFTIGRRYKKQASDTCKAWRSTPLFHFESIDDMKNHLPFDAMLIGIELDARSTPLAGFPHPSRCVYLLGAEDHGLSPEVRDKCHRLIQLPGRECLNVATAGGITMYDRVTRGAYDPKGLICQTIQD